MNGIEPFRSRAGFGLGRLHHVVSAAQRERIVLGACDAGFSHFDLAPAYGDGLCEAEAGRILRGRRPMVSIATKFGIPESSLGARNIPLYFAAKAFRKALSRSYGAEYSQRDFSRGEAVRSLEQSLKRLRTDYVDHLFFHEPRDQHDSGAIQETIETMERLKREGKILHYGISARTEQFLTSRVDRSVGEVVQFELAPQSTELVALLPDGCRTSAFGLMRFLMRNDHSGRLDYAEVLQWFFERFPKTVPILASNRPSEIERLGRALAGLPHRFSRKA